MDKNKLTGVQQALNKADLRYAWSIDPAKLLELLKPYLYERTVATERLRSISGRIDQDETKVYLESIIQQYNENIKTILGL